MAKKRYRLELPAMLLACQMLDKNIKDYPVCRKNKYRITLDEDIYNKIAEQIANPTKAPKKEKVKTDIYEKLKIIYSEEELRALSMGKGLASQLAYDSFVNIGTIGHHKIGIITDTHIGSKYTNSQYIIDAIEKFNKEGCEFILLPGDVSEGFSGREGHCYECSHFGFDSQLSECIRVFSTSKLPIYAISGNHDAWYFNKIGANIVSSLANQINNFYHIGNDMATIKVGSIHIMLWHGTDGNSYATSYRIQKIIESLQGGTKPNILLCGHTHKECYIFERNIHALSCGCMQFQSDWMRGKKLSAHTGYNIIDIDECNAEVIKFTNTFYPLYK